MSYDVGKLISVTNQRVAEIAIREKDPKKALPLLKGLIKTLNKEHSLHKRRTVETAVEMGQALAAVRGLIPHGKWATWVEKNTDFTPRHAARLIQLSVYYQGLEEQNRTLVSDLTLKAAIEMARQKADPAKFDAEDFPARIAEMPPEDVDEDAPWTEPSEVQAEARNIPTQAPPPPVSAAIVAPEMTDIIERIAAPFGALRAMVDEREKTATHKPSIISEVNQSPQSVGASAEEITEAEFREITPKPASTNRITPANCDYQAASDAIRQSIAPIATVDTRSTEMVPPVSRNDLLRDAARLMKRAANGEEITRDEATDWLSVFDAWSREIGMEDDARGSHD